MTLTQKGTGNQGGECVMATWAQEFVKAHSKIDLKLVCFIMCKFKLDQIYFYMHALLKVVATAPGIP